VPGQCFRGPGRPPGPKPASDRLAPRLPLSGWHTWHGPQPQHSTRVSPLRPGLRVRPLAAASARAGRGTGTCTGTDSELELQVGFKLKFRWHPWGPSPGLARTRCHPSRIRLAACQCDRASDSLSGGGACHWRLMLNCDGLANRVGQPERRHSGGRGRRWAGGRRRACSADGGAVGVLVLARVRRARPG
jgi:hypothetical protein